MLAANWFMLPFRFLHIVSGALWVGAAFLFVGFIGPSAAEVGPAAGPLLNVAVKKRKVAKVITWLGMITVTAGWIMWFKLGLDAPTFGDWIGTVYAKVLLVAGILATLTFFVGYLGVGRNVERMVDLGNEIAASGGPPSPVQQAEMDRLGAALQKHGKLDLVLLLIVVSLMATAQYW